MASLALTSQPLPRDATSYDLLNVFNHAPVTVLPVDANHAEELDLTRLIYLHCYTKKNYNVQVTVRITTNVLEPTVSDYNIGARPNGFLTPLLPVKWHHNIRSDHNRSLTPSSSETGKVMYNAMLFFQLSFLYLLVHIRVVDNLAVPVLAGTSFIARFVREMFPNEWHIVPSGLAQWQQFQNTSPCPPWWLYYRAIGALRPILTTDSTKRKGHRHLESQSVSKYGQIQ